VEANPDDGGAPITTVQNEAEQIEAEQIEAEQIEAEQTETAENDEELEEDDDEDDGRGNPKGKGKEKERDEGHGDEDRRQSSRLESASGRPDGRKAAPWDVRNRCCETAQSGKPLGA
jgi:hypothetical protein